MHAACKLLFPVTNLYFVFAIEKKILKKPSLVFEMAENKIKGRMI